MMTMLATLLVAFTAQTRAEETINVSIHGEQMHELTTGNVSQSKTSLRSTARSSGMADYGNWCGAGNTKADRNYPTIDGVDEVCRRHDLCLKDKGYHECNCDADFMKSMARASARSVHGESYRLAAVGVFVHKPCECRRRRCILKNPFSGNCIQHVSYTSVGVGGICVG